MPSANVTILLDTQLLRRLDLLVEEKLFPNRSNLIQEAIREKLSRVDKSRLARECEKLDPEYEQSIAEKGML